jgi:flagellin-like protein
MLLRTHRKRKKGGVSPVIATILLVAITVVLIGILYIWVSSLISTDKTETPKATGYVYTRIDEFDQEYFYVTIESVTGQAPYVSAVKWKVLDSGGAMVDSGDVDDPMVYGNTTLFWHKSWTTSATDYTNTGFGDEPGDGILNQNDYFVLRSSSLSNTPTGKAERGGALVLEYIPTGDQIAKITL